MAQLGGVHLACEQSSNVLSKVLEWGRLMAYLEQSTRYIAYNNRLDNGHYRYFRPPEILDSPSVPASSATWTASSTPTASCCPQMQAWVAERFPQQAGDSDFVYRQATQAKSLDALRGLLPAASLSNIGIYGTGQSYEQLLLRMRAHPLPEARHYADMMLTELRKVIPSFLQRVDVPSAAGSGPTTWPSTATATARLVARLWPELDGSDPGDARRRRRRARGDAARLRPRRGREGPGGRVFRAPRLFASARRRGGCAGSATTIASPCWRPTSATGATGGTVPVAPSSAPTTASSSSPTTAPSATCSGTACSPSSGSASASRSATTCPSSSPTPGWPSDYDEAIDRAEDLYRSLLPDFPEQASYAVALAHRIRYVMQFNAREAMHLIELRSGAQGHPAYRRVAQQMHRAIAEEAGHRALAEAMTFVDHGATDLERLESERRAERRRSEKSATH